MTGIQGYTTMPHDNNATYLSCSGDLSPSDQPPVLVNTSTQRNLLSNFRTCRLSESNFGEILFVSGYPQVRGLQL